MITACYLSVEHSTWGNFHVVAQLKIRKEIDSLSHADVSIRLEAYICHWSAGVYYTDDVLCDDIESRHLQKELLCLSTFFT